ncbi:MAG: dTDP-glucose 4,6-dehydratase [Nitrospirae bacterium GWC2_57_13]|jgi:dTDP-glucose 4,6-dehydratase|nr:MAG: dTDP-glucose 4,6-dehydratase [Nitrospirae bacterium GWC1_57_7]OGW27857.1 MAG: dTDP-glucose 4,6-dehydratase [Nitrospirae bacterium GWC2_57_13]OGW45746.1 MAG: dTDP-glucose 4,6-dehydratase [Nitrospirae bacterium GWD2_57_8]HAR46449.1 dTDP-glucose 4,6-dehydratase [Nitrospiraceae bacterium]HAS55116.1 dTDP-glucose 4,6-dehydratase [Nitrospiraceae bacterium]
MENSKVKNILVTGGAGFIGSNFIRYVLGRKEFKGRIINFDKLTYASNLLNLADVEKNFGGKQYFFEQGDICDYGRVESVLTQYDVSVIVHFAAESHVDRSIFGPKQFVETNVNGTFTLLEAARHHWQGRNDFRFHHISTDEVYGSLGESGQFFETTPYDPRSPYSASKASSDHLVRAYHHTYGLPMTLSNCSNNYGPYHFPEKLIPLAILNALEGKPLPVYGDGQNVRDWLYVEDHCEAIWLILQAGRAGETYNIGGECEKKNIEVVNAICDVLEMLSSSKDNPALRTPPARVLSLSEPGRAQSTVRTYKDLITFVADRPGHDRRYAINCDKIKQQLGWRPRHDFLQGLHQTVAWYLSHPDWVAQVRSGEYRAWMEKNYGGRGKSA